MILGYLVCIFGCSSKNSKYQTYRAPSQDIALAEELTKKYEENYYIANSSVHEITFQKPNREEGIQTVQASERVVEEIVSLAPSGSFKNVIPYDDLSNVSPLIVKDTYSKYRKPRVSRSSYEQDGIFHSDAKSYYYSIPMYYWGEVIKYQYIKTYTDVKYILPLYFRSFYPSERKEFRITIPTWLDAEIKEFNFDEYTIEHTTESSKEGGITHIYTLKEGGVWKRENHAPGGSHSEPHIVIICKSYEEAGQKQALIGSVDDLYGWYKSLTNKIYNDNERIQELVTELTQDKTNDLDKIEAIYYWVQDNIRYIAFEDGIAGYKPEACQAVLKKRFGDCKGMANLVKQMLVLAGFDARLTWIGTRRLAYDYSTPSIIVDNHMICTLILDGKKYFLDPTEEYIPFGENAFRIQGRQVLIEDGENFILDRVPTNDYKNNEIAHHITMEIAGNKLKGEGQYVYLGEGKLNFLVGYNSLRTDRQEEALENYISDQEKNMQVSKIETSDLSNRTAPVHVKYQFETANQILEVGDELYITMDFEQELKHYDFDSDREKDFLFDYKSYQVSEYELLIPSGYKVIHLPKTLRIDEPSYLFTIELTQQGKRILYKKELAIKEGIIKKNDFSQWNASIKKLRAAYNDCVVLKKQ